MLISQGSFRVCKNHNVILLILFTLLEKLATLLNLLKKLTTFKISPGLEPRCAMCTLRLWPRCCSFSTVRPSWSSGKTLTANAGGLGFESHRGQNLFSTFYSIKVECEELFYKTNKTLKLTKKIIVKLSILI